MALVGMEAVSPWLHIGTNLLLGMWPVVRAGRSKKLMVIGFTPRRVILPLSAEKPLAVCTKRKSTFFTALPCGWATSDLEVSLEGVAGKQMDSCYEPGERAGARIKHHTNMEQVFVICGYSARRTGLQDFEYVGGSKPNWPRSGTENTRRMIKGQGYSQLPRADCSKVTSTANSRPNAVGRPL
jgi:hypothetical protein